MKTIKKIVSHFGRHLDEYFAELQAKMFGRLRFHLLSACGHEEVSVADESMNSLSKQHPDWLCLGIGGGPFDDHGAQKKKSCSQLMAEYLGIQEDPRLVILLELVTEHDKKGTKTTDEFTLPRAINFMHRHGFTPEQMEKWMAHGVTPEQAIREWVEQGLLGLMDSEALLLDEIKSSIGKMASKEAFQTELRTRFFKEKRVWDTFNLEAIAETLGDKGPAWLAFGKEVVLRQRKVFQSAREVAFRSVEAINSKFGLVRFMNIDGSDGKYAPFEVEFDGCSRARSVNADLVLVRNSQGHTLIAVNSGFNGNLTGFVKVLRVAEAKKRGQEFPKQYHIVEGSVPVEGFTTWYVHEGLDYKRIYNGTTTRPIVDFSELSFEEIKDLLLKWLDVKKFTAMPLNEGPANLEHAFTGTLFEKAADAS